MMASCSLRGNGRTGAWVMAGAALALLMPVAFAQEGMLSPDATRTTHDGAISKDGVQTAMEEGSSGQQTASSRRAESRGERTSDLNAGGRRKVRKQASADGQDDHADDEPEKRPVDQGALLQTQSASGQVKVRSWKTLRDDGIVKQDLDYSCGAASAATLLNSFYGQKVSEKRFLKAMGEEDGMASFDDMARAMPGFGFKARGFAASWDQLVKLKIPVIVYVKYRKDDHFSVLRGISGDTVWLADPSLGNRTFSKAQFLQMWQTRKDGRRPELAGKFLAVLPARADISREENYFSKLPRRQSAAAVEQLGFRRP